ncbi:MAG: NADPH-dependent glutamate synthase [Deltaproteobacteria bacterium]|nr:NADPH-dependent glutamate synthase [Deltaproteobacteria bacterium]
MPEAPALERRNGFQEVSLGYTPELAKVEADRCLLCKKPLCVPGCPVAIDIPGFIRQLSDGNLPAAYEILKRSNPLPAVCGRVCPQETQCEVKCVMGRKGEPVAIGRLERFVGDWGVAHGAAEEVEARLTGKKVAIVGSGPAGIACAQDLARAGVAVTIYEALHEVGGVLVYGIPPFRLPRKIVNQEIEGLKRLGVRIERNKVIGKIFTIEQLLHTKGFDAVFIGTGAGLPKFMGIPGEHLNGVMSANEFLTRVNLMHGYEKADTPIGMGDSVIVIGAGNTALDAARTALRMGAKEVTIVYRRTEKESPARLEELRHATEEGIQFCWLTQPVRLHGDVNGSVVAMECLRMELGEPDLSGRRSPRPVTGSEFRIQADTVIYALGTVANPIIARSTPCLKVNQQGYLEIDPQTQMTSIPGVFAGGDIVTGSATVILALGAGRRAAQGILQYLGLSREEERGEGHGLTMPAVSRAG